jgi:flavin reductase (DIM6/NTAB) family NADH-FMN oxidoreductase RutF
LRKALRTQSHKGMRESGLTEFDVTSLDPALAYKLLVGAVQPRPIAWVSTVAADGTPNLAPFSFFTVASREPATVLVSIGPKIDGGVKDTLENIRATNDFVVNIPSTEHRGAVSTTGTTVAPEVDEFELAGVTALNSVKVRAPRLAEARLSLECRFREAVRIGTDTAVFGTVVWAHCAPGVMDERVRVDNEVLQPLGRLAGPWFTGPLTAVAEELPQPTAVSRD